MALRRCRTGILCALEVHHDTCVQLAPKEAACDAPKSCLVMGAEGHSLTSYVPLSSSELTCQSLLLASLTTNGKDTAIYDASGLPEMIGED